MVIKIYAIDGQQEALGIFIALTGGCTEVSCVRADLDSHSSGCQAWRTNNAKIIIRIANDQILKNEDKLWA